LTLILTEAESLRSFQTSLRSGTTCRFGQALRADLWIYERAVESVLELAGIGVAGGERHDGWVGMKPSEELGESSRQEDNRE
jgi:hypothetical protein